MKILSLSTDQELSQLRKTILEAAGREVLALNAEKEAVQAAQGPVHYDVVLLCHHFPAATARQFVRLLRQHHPDTRIIYIVHVYGEWPEIEADRYVVGADGPAALLRVLEEVQLSPASTDLFAARLDYGRILSRLNSRVCSKIQRLLYKNCATNNPQLSFPLGVGSTRHGIGD